MTHSLQGAGPSRRAWRAFSARDGRRIDVSVRAGRPPLCPCCGGALEARRASTLRGKVPLDAVALDLDCGGCRRSWSIVQHTERSMHLVRMRRFVAALRAVQPKPSTNVAAIA